MKNCFKISYDFLRHPLCGKMVFFETFVDRGVNFVLKISVKARTVFIITSFIFIKIRGKSWLCLHFTGGFFAHFTVRGFLPPILHRLSCQLFRIFIDYTGTLYNTLKVRPARLDLHESGAIR